jgi:hypothetical protein
MLRGELKSKAAPTEEQAVEAYRVCVQKANDLGVYNKWSVKAFDQLQKLRPLEYQPVTERFAKLDLSDKLEVVRSGVVVPDGESYKNVNVALQGGAVPEGEKTKAAAGGNTATAKAEKGDGGEAATADAGENAPKPQKAAPKKGKRKGGGR